MKRAAAILIALCMCFSLCSCYTYEDIENARNSANEEAEEKISSLEESAREAETHYENRIYELEEELDERYDDGHLDGYDEGYEEGYRQGKEEGYYKGYDEGHSDGYREGFSEAESICEDEHSSYTSYSNTQQSTSGSVDYIVNQQPVQQVEQLPPSESYTVYITKTGDKYHTSTCSYLKNSKISISKDSAIAQGYTACSRCKP